MTLHRITLALASTHKCSPGSISGLSTKILFKDVTSVTEVNVGIICACLLTFPAFLERHGPRTFGSLINILLSYTPFRLSERSSSSSSNKKRVKSSSWSPKNQSDEIVLRGSEYAKVNSDGNSISIRDKESTRTANHETPSLTKAGGSKRDVET